MSVSSSCLPSALALFLLAGCAGSVDGGKFSALRDAASQVNRGGQASFAQLRREARDSAVLSYADRKVGVQGFPLVNAQGESYDLAAPLSRVAASLDALDCYAQALAKLAGGGKTEDIDHASQNLAASLRGLQASGMDARAANGVAIAVDALGQAMLAAQRREGLRGVMDRAQPGLDALAQMIERVDADLKLYLLNIRLRYLNLVNRDGVRPPYHSWERYRFDQAVAEQLASYDRLDQALAATDKAVRDFPELHRQLRASLDQPGRPVDRLHDFIAEARRLRALYREMPDS
ncbi:hypothetical protein DK842_16475 [Chromobacterium phragmitis]|uniref:hypothetical protein n=1 Tax=Chromobacterium phragmitis TaxID=2202141 RepID=UPI000DEC65E8|nr:hypothetical protein [Chromobacterium phragmitis]AXE31354.1 hypothetical protein DK842_16475 [Chromobacterium phragmitis]